MKIVIFSDNGSSVVNTDDGTMDWYILNSDGTKQCAAVMMHEYRELSVHKFAYIASFRDVSQEEIRSAIMRQMFN
ncbi:hypothetical protein OUHCRE2_36930 [Enterobacter asburiae]|uniref:Uncharacterized protein n=1 Tax=Enterobacter cloacae TaxID=550 RepID=A0AAW6SAF6_ENTCL|nr:MULTISPECIES: hypothetical protein [Enterobacter cloacae complex]MDH0199301.1 hypothetical protein [Enterobacter cloacae]GJK28195.1 hypothetical protein TUM17556_01140 [Enterobacter asburiae]HAS1758970.1 hypothetical protein [Enterobacter asburiae]HBM2856653.1 hypothetical protein [Enterobacter cloacae]HBO0722215.1 hypothetical protein [Enterobacter asburiae]